jgi:hypothetical protein
MHLWLEAVLESKTGLSGDRRHFIVCKDSQIEPRRTVDEILNEMAPDFSLTSSRTYRERLGEDGVGYVLAETADYLLIIECERAYTEAEFLEMDCEPVNLDPRVWDSVISGIR